MNIKREIELIKKQLNEQYSETFTTMFALELRLWSIQKAIESDTGEFIEIDVSTVNDKLKRAAFKHWRKHGYVSDDVLEKIYLQNKGEK